MIQTSKHVVQCLLVTRPDGFVKCRFLHDDDHLVLRDGVARRARRVLRTRLLRGRIAVGWCVGLFRRGSA